MKKKQAPYQLPRRPIISRKTATTRQQQQQQPPSPSTSRRRTRREDDGGGEGNGGEEVGGEEVGGERGREERDNGGESGEENDAVLLEGLPPPGAFPEDRTPTPVGFG